MADSMTEAADPFKIEAVVSMNGGEALVLNRAPRPLYEFSGKDLIGRDGPFIDVLKYDPPSGRFKAFAGREFDVPMADGSMVKASGQYWSAGLKGAVDAAWGTESGLKNCYVFKSGSWDADALAELRSEYTGEVFPYWAYEALLNANDWRSAASRAKWKAEKDKKHILRNLRSIAAERDQLLKLLEAVKSEAWAEERAACAKACDDELANARGMKLPHEAIGAKWCRDAIRARGESE